MDFKKRDQVRNTLYAFQGLPTLTLVSCLQRFWFGDSAATGRSVPVQHIQLFAFFFTSTVCLDQLNELVM